MPETARTTWIEFVLSRLESGPILAAELKTEFFQTFPDMEDSAYRHLMTSLLYAGMLDNLGTKRASTYVLTDIGQAALEAIRQGKA